MRDEGLIPVAIFKHEGDLYRLSRFVEPSQLNWYEIIADASAAPPHRSKSWLMRLQKGTELHLLCGHDVATFVLHRGPVAGLTGRQTWVPYDAFALINDIKDQTIQSSNRLHDIIRSYEEDPEELNFETRVIFWTLFELCELDVDDLFLPLIFELQIPDDVPDGSLEKARRAPSYIALHQALERWRDDPPHELKQVQRINQIIKYMDDVLDNVIPGDATRYWGEARTPLDLGTNTDTLEFELSHFGSSRYTLHLVLFNDDKPVTPSWFIIDDNKTLERRDDDLGLDLIHNLIANRIIIADSLFDEWLDANIATPTQILEHIDNEPYALVGYSSPWLWKGSKLEALIDAMKE